MVVEVPWKSKKAHFVWDIINKNCVFRRFASLGCLGGSWGGLEVVFKGLGAVLDSVRGSWGTDRARF